MIEEAVHPLQQFVSTTPGLSCRECTISLRREISMTLFNNCKNECTTHMSSSLAIMIWSGKSINLIHLLMFESSFDWRKNWNHQRQWSNFIVRKRSNLLLVSITYEQCVKEIETVRDSGQVSIIRSYLRYEPSHKRDYYIEWMYATDKSFHFIVALKHLFGIVNSCTRVICGK